EAAATDALTGLLNRQEFDRRLALAHTREYAVLVVDVDRLKMINDSFGHEAGDAVIRAIARCLRNLCGEGTALARTGGDEFSLLVEVLDGDAAARLGEQLRRALYGVAVPFGLARISVGIAAGAAGEAGWIVRDRADEALDRAKRRGRDRVEQSAGAQRQARTPARRIEQAVRDIIGAGSVQAVYQPVVRLADMAVVDYEALARPLGAPADSSVEALFAAAHRTGLMRDLDWLCRRAAVHQRRRVGAARPAARRRPDAARAALGEPRGARGGAGDHRARGGLRPGPLRGGHRHLPGAGLPLRHRRRRRGPLHPRGAGRLESRVHQGGALADRVVRPRRAALGDPRRGRLRPLQRRADHRRGHRGPAALRDHGRAGRRPRPGLAPGQAGPGAGSRGAGSRGRRPGRLRSAGSHVAAAPCEAVTASVPGFPERFPVRGEDRRPWRYRVVAGTARLCFRVRYGRHPVDFRDLANIPDGPGPLIVACNHLSNLDPLIMGAFFPRTLFAMAKKELFPNRLIAWMWAGCNTFPIDRGSADRRALRTAIDVLQRGGRLLLFIEGTRTTTPGMKRAEPGVGFLLR